MCVFVVRHGRSLVEKNAELETQSTLSRPAPRRFLGSLKNGLSTSLLYTVLEGRSSSSGIYYTENSGFDKMPYLLHLQKALPRDGTRSGET